MKKIYNILLVLTVPVLFLTLTSEIMKHDGSPGGKTGSPGDEGNNCTDCHSGTTINQENWIYSPQLLVQGYSPGQLYNFFVIGIDDDASKYGFEATAEDVNGTKVGEFQAGILGMTQTLNNSKAITHTALGNVPLLDSSTLWMFNWIAPPETVGTITFYAAVNAANGNGANTGDKINLTQFSVSPATGISTREEKNVLGIYPNPSTGMISLEKADSKTTEKVEVYNLNGQMVFHKPIQPGNSRIDLTALKKGIYIVRMGNKSQQLVIR